MQLVTFHFWLYTSLNQQPSFNYISICYIKIKKCTASLDLCLHPGSEMRKGLNRQGYSQSMAASLASDD